MNKKNVKNAVRAPVTEGECESPHATTSSLRHTNEIKSGIKASCGWWCVRRRGHTHQANDLVVTSAGEFHQSGLLDGLYVPLAVLLGTLEGDRSGRRGKRSR